MTTSKSTLKVVIKFQRDPLTIKAYAVYGEVNRITPNRVIKTNYYSIYVTIEGFDD